MRRTLSNAAIAAALVALFAAAHSEAQPDAAAIEAKELKRMRAMDSKTFCVKELGKLRRIKGTPPTAWFNALAARARDGEITGHHLTLIQDGKAKIGMPACAAIGSWGRPERVNRSTYSFGVREQWVYGDGNYLFFDDGKLSSVVTSQ